MVIYKLAANTTITIPDNIVASLNIKTCPLKPLKGAGNLMRYSMTKRELQGSDSTKRSNAVDTFKSTYLTDSAKPSFETIAPGIRSAAAAGSAFATALSNVTNCPSYTP